VAMRIMLHSKVAVTMESYTEAPLGRHPRCLPQAEHSGSWVWNRLRQVPVTPGAAESPHRSTPPATRREHITQRHQLLGSAPEPNPPTYLFYGAVAVTPPGYSAPICPGERHATGRTLRPSR
jgi:hypothetical protein